MLILTSLGGRAMEVRTRRPRALRGVAESIALPPPLLLISDPGGKPATASAITFLAAGAAQPQEVATQMDTVNLGSRLELFVDRYLIEELRNAELEIHRPQKLPLADSPIAGAYMTVLKDGDVYRAYFREYLPGYNGPQTDGNAGELICYAESRDGHEWSFPDLGVLEVQSARGRNVLLARESHCTHNFSPFLDARPKVDPKERFKALAGTHAGGGLYAFTSPDGIHWTLVQEEPVLTSEAFAFDSQNVSFWSEAEGCYLCYFRTWKTPHGSLRTVSRATSPDFVHWSEPQALPPNLPGEHLYTTQTHPYFRAPHLYVALPTRFVPSRGDSTEILFMTSRAGGPYERLSHDAYLRPGLDPARWGNRANYAALNVVPTGPEEMSIYHAGSGHRYVLRTDGFVSVRAPFEGGELLTKPLLFRGSELVLNLSTSATGSLQVELQTPAGAPVPGFTLDDCPALATDAIEHVVSWKSGSDVSSLAGSPVRLRFVMRDCDLYSIRFR